MNEVLQSLMTRRSVRKYNGKQVPDETLDAILQAGIYAPSGNGRQSGKVVILQNPEDIQALEQLNAAAMGSDGHPFYGAPTVVLVLADPEVPTYVEDGAAILCNLVNAAHAMGVASCWIHRARPVFEQEAGKALLRKWGIDEKYAGIGHCLLGYSDDAPGEPKARKADYIVKV